MPLVLRRAKAIESVLVDRRDGEELRVVGAQQGYAGYVCVGPLSGRCIVPTWEVAPFGERFTLRTRFVRWPERVLTE